MMRSVVLMVAVVVMIIVMAYMFTSPMTSQPTEYQYTEFIKLVKEGKVADVYAVQTQLVGRFTNSKIAENAFPDHYDFTASIPSSDQLMSDLKGIAAEAKQMAPEVVTSADLTVNVKIGQPQGESVLLQLLPLIMRASDNFSAINDHGPNGHLIFPLRVTRFKNRFTHEMLVNQVFVNFHMIQTPLSCFRSASPSFSFFTDAAIQTKIPFSPIISDKRKFARWRGKKFWGQISKRVNKTELNSVYRKNNEKNKKRIRKK